MHYLKNSVHDFGNLVCSQIENATLKNPNNKIRNTKQYRNPNLQNSKQIAILRRGIFETEALGSNILIVYHFMGKIEDEVPLLSGAKVVASTVQIL